MLRNLVIDKQGLGHSRIRTRSTAIETRVIRVVGWLGRGRFARTGLPVARTTRIGSAIATSSSWTPIDLSRAHVSIASADMALAFLHRSDRQIAGWLAVGMIHVDLLLATQRSVRTAGGFE